MRKREERGREGGDGVAGMKTRGREARMEKRGGKRGRGGRNLIIVTKRHDGPND